MARATTQILLLAAVLVAVGWFILAPGPEPAIAAIMGLVTVLSTRIAGSAGGRKGSPGSEAETDGSQQVSSGGRRAEKSIVVTPFETVGPGEDEYFSDGLTDEIITDLSKVGALRVIARGSSMKLKGRDLDYDGLADLLGVGYAVEGSVRKREDALRISAHVVDLSTGTVLWGDRYEGALEDIFEIQDSVAAAVVEALRIELTSLERQQIEERPVPDAVAYDEFLRARPDIYTMSAEGLVRAETHLERALDICPENPLLLKGLGLVQYQRYNSGLSSDPDLIERVVSYADRIEAGSPGRGDAELLRGLAAEYAGPDPKAAVEHLRRGYALDPGNLDVRFWLSISSMSTGQMELATGLAESLVTVDPLAPLPHAFVALAYFFRGRPREGLNALRRAQELGPDVPPVWFAATRVLVSAGDLDGAEEAVAHLRSRYPDSPFATLSEGLLLAAGGDADRSLAFLTDEVRDWAWKAGEWAQAVGDWCAEAGSVDEAVRWLERSRRRGFINYPFVAELDPHLAALRGRDEFAAYLERVRADQAEFERRLDDVPEP